MTKKRKQSKPSLDSGVVPYVHQLPPALRDLPWLDKLLLADDLLRNPRRFLARCTASEFDARYNPAALPKATSKIPVRELRGFLEACLPGYGESMTLRRIQSMLTRSRLGDAPLDSLQTAVERLVNGFLPLRDHGLVGEDRWETARQAVTDYIADSILPEIESAIADRLLAGDRHDSILATADLPPTRFHAVHSDSNLNWSLTPAVWFVGVRIEDIPAKSPLRQWPVERYPRVGGIHGLPMMLLGPSIPSVQPSSPIPRPFYHLGNVATLNDAAWQHHTKRRLDYLRSQIGDYHSADDVEELTNLEELAKKPYRRLWTYPDAPSVPALDGFSVRALFAVDVLSSVRGAIKPPPPSTPLADLLAARRLFIDSVVDEQPQLRQHAAKAWTAKVFSTFQRDELLACLTALASSTASAIDELSASLHFSLLEKYQKEINKW